MSASTVITPIGMATCQSYDDRSRPLAGHVRESLERYFDELNGQAPSELYDLVLSEIEQPLLEVVMAQTRGNISKAAAFLGLNRATLRKKLQRYRISS